MDLLRSHSSIRFFGVEWRKSLDSCNRRRREVKHEVVDVSGRGSTTSAPHSSPSRTLLQGLGIPNRNHCHWFSISVNRTATEGTQIAAIKDLRSLPKLQNNLRGDDLG
jgi:hypothetical protein